MSCRFEVLVVSVIFYVVGLFDLCRREIGKSFFDLGTIVEATSHEVHGFAGGAVVYQVRLSPSVPS